MAQRIKQFEGGKISLNQFVDDVDGLLEGVESAEESWRASFRKGLAELKDVCAQAGDRRKKELPAEDRGLVDDSVTRIKGLLVCKRRSKSAAGGRGGPKVRHPDRTGGCTAIWNNGPRFVDECW